MEWSTLSELVKLRLGQVVADDTEGEGHPLQGIDGVLVGHVVAGEDDPDPEHKVKVNPPIHSYLYYLYHCSL